MDTVHIGKEKRRMPVLRFKEFDGEWVSKRIGKVFKINAGGDVEKSHVSDIKTEDFQYPIYANAKKEKGLYGYSDLYKVEAGTITVAGRGVYIGIAHARNHRFYPIVRLLVLRPLNHENIYFGEYAINRLRIFVESTGVPQLTAPQFSSYKVSFPSLPEQKKIATFLSTIDKKMQQLTRKKALLEQYKKGLMQQLFSGELRFKDEEGKDYPAWEEKLYGDIFSFYPTNSFSRVNLNYESGEVKNIHYGDIHTKFSTLFNIREELVPYINSEINIAKIKAECYCQEGDLVIADASEDYSDIGKSIELIELNNEKLVAGLHTFLARPNKTKMHIGFSGYLVQAWYIRKQIMRIAQGTKVLGLSTTRMVKLKVNIPSLQEQKKIANYLSSIDTKIATITTQITKTQTFKKGLLQQMFV